MGSVSGAERLVRERRAKAPGFLWLGNKVISGAL